jgi:hypothetical protein
VGVGIYRSAYSSLLSLTFSLSPLASLLPLSLSCRGLAEVSVCVLRVLGGCGVHAQGGSRMHVCLRAGCVYATRTFSECSGVGCFCGQLNGESHRFKCQRLLQAGCPPTPRSRVCVYIFASACAFCACVSLAFGEKCDEREMEGGSTYPRRCLCCVERGTRRHTPAVVCGRVSAVE